VTLLDVPGAGDRNGAAKGRVAASAQGEAAAVHELDRAALITVGKSGDDLPRLAECDWIVEAIIEQPAPEASAVRAARGDRQTDGDRVDEHVRYSDPLARRDRGQTNSAAILGTPLFQSAAISAPVGTHPTERTARIVVTRVRDSASASSARASSSHATSGLHRKPLGIHWLPECDTT
jgi:hypothetical protein